MNPVLIASLALQYGLPFVTGLIAKIEAGGVVTSAEWAELVKLANQNAQTQMMDAFKRNNVDPNSPLGKELLALLP